MSTESTTATSTDFEEHDNLNTPLRDVKTEDAKPWTVPVNRDAGGAVIGIGLFVSEEELRIMGIDPDENDEVVAVARPGGLEIVAAD